MAKSTLAQRSRKRVKRIKKIIRAGKSDLARTLRK